LENLERGKMFTVALVVNSSVNGGAEQYLYDLYRELLKRNICKVVLVGSLPNWPSKLGEQRYTGVPRKFTRKSSISVQIFQALFYPMRVRRLIRGLKPDLIHMQFMREKFLLPALLKKYCPVLWTEHGHGFDDLSGLPLKIFKWQSKFSTVISISQGVKKGLNKHGISSILIHNPIPDVAINLHSKQEDFESNPSDRFKVMYVGRIHEDKRIELLIEVAKLLPDIDFVIAGEGAYQQVLSGKSSPNVSFVGFVHDVKNLMKSANVVVITSGQAAREGSPLVMLEARSLGIPVLIASDCHAAIEAKSLGCKLFHPEPSALFHALLTTMKFGEILPLDEKIRADRSVEKWASRHTEVMLGMLRK